MQLKNTLLRIALLFLLAELLSSCFMAEGRAPRGRVQIHGQDSASLSKDYQQLMAYLKGRGYEQKSVDEQYAAFFGGKPTGFYRDFELQEHGGNYVISLQLDMSQTQMLIIYQYAEYEGRTPEKIPPVFSAEGCDETKGLNDQVISLAGTENVDLQGVLQCK